MIRKPLELPPAVARGFVKPLRLSDIKEMFRELKGIVS
jgi:hypothetical protein